jgi:RNA polymerase sigma-70 factor (ECF subfamily)
VHIEAPGPQDTHWTRIVQLYDALLELDSSPIIGLNRAIAIAMRDGPATGLAIMEELLADGKLNDYRFAHAARADMYRRLGRVEEARSAYESALALTSQEAERRFIAGRIAELTHRIR